MESFSILGAKIQNFSEIRNVEEKNVQIHSQDFTEYWHDGPHTEDFSWLTYKHGQQQKYC